MDPVRPGSPYQPVIEALGNYPQKKFYNVSKLGGAKYDTLPYSIRVLFESSIRNCDGFLVKETDAMNILDWKTKQNNVEVPFCPARVVLQDFTGIPAMVDFAAMREAVRNAGGDPVKVNPACPTDLTVDHSLQIDFSKCCLVTAPEKRLAILLVILKDCHFSPQFRTDFFYISFLWAWILQQIEKGCMYLQREKCNCRSLEKYWNWKTNSVVFLF